MSAVASQGRTLEGTVVSDKNDQTIVVKVVRRVKHPLYGKVITKTTKVHAHDPENRAAVGQSVVVKECKPFSKKKVWLLVDVLEK